MASDKCGKDKVRCQLLLQLGHEAARVQLTETWKAFRIQETCPVLREVRPGDLNMSSEDSSPAWLQCLFGQT